MQQTQSPKAGERTQDIERTSEDTARFHGDMKRIHESATPNPGPHTPGPWTAHEFKDGIVELTEFGGSAVAYIEPTKLRSKSERKANAKLIAAAPDLLAACKAFEGYYCGAPDSTTRGMAHAYEIVRTAIAKVEQS